MAGGHRGTARLAGSSSVLVGAAVAAVVAGRSGAGRLGRQRRHHRCPATRIRVLVTTDRSRHRAAGRRHPRRPCGWPAGQSRRNGARRRQLLICGSSTPTSGSRGRGRCWLVLRRVARGMARLPLVGLAWRIVLLRHRCLADHRCRQYHATVGVIVAADHLLPWTTKMRTTIRGTQEIARVPLSAPVVRSAGQRAFVDAARALAPRSASAAVTAARGGTVGRGSWPSPRRRTTGGRTHVMTVTADAHRIDRKADLLLGQAIMPA